MDREWELERIIMDMKIKKTVWFAYTSGATVLGPNWVRISPQSQIGIVLVKLSLSPATEQPWLLPLLRTLPIMGTFVSFDTTKVTGPSSGQTLMG
jgi:hypothetical protein